VAFASQHMPYSMAWPCDGQRRAVAKAVSLMQFNDGALNLLHKT
jgi:hypothetical protein